jgi:hypothetical protein
MRTLLKRYWYTGLLRTKRTEYCTDSIQGRGLQLSLNICLYKSCSTLFLLFIGTQVSLKVVFLMGLAAKRRNGGNGPPRPKTGARVKEKRYDDARDRKRPPRRAQSTAPTPNPKRRRFLDPATLAQGMTARGLGARVQLTILAPDEIERDLRHMEAYANACTAYAQQFFIYHNRSLVQSGQFGPVTAPTVVSTEQYVNGEAYDPYRRAMPVRIDPEEEKRVSLLRKRIATSESQREILETEYMSLRAHYVYESQRLRRTRQAADGQLKVLQDLVKSRGAVVALRRVRCAVARDILKALEKRNQALTEGKSLDHESKPAGPDILEVWNEIEDNLREAEKACHGVPIPEDLALLKNDNKGKKKKDKKQQAGDEEEERVVPWDCRKMPGAPEGVPTLLSLMSSNPERAAAWSKSQNFLLQQNFTSALTIVCSCRLWWNVWKQGFVYVLGHAESPHIVRKDGTRTRGTS